MIILLNTKHIHMKSRLYYLGAFSNRRVLFNFISSSLLCKSNINIRHLYSLRMFLIWCVRFITILLKIKLNQIVLGEFVFCVVQRWIDCLPAVEVFSWELVGCLLNKWMFFHTFVIKNPLVFVVNCDCQHNYLN